MYTRLLLTVFAVCWWAGSVQYSGFIRAFFAKNIAYFGQKRRYEIGESETKQQSLGCENQNNKLKDTKRLLGDNSLPVSHNKRPI